MDIEGRSSGITSEHLLGIGVVYCQTLCGEMESRVHLRILLPAYTSSTLVR